jgi:hypothetical protein
MSSAGGGWYAHVLLPPGQCELPQLFIFFSLVLPTHISGATLGQLSLLLHANGVLHWSTTLIPTPADVLQTIDSDATKVEAAFNGDVCYY